MEEKKLNEKESLELIARMIQNTQNKLERGRGTHFLVGGYVTVFITIAVWALLSITSNPAWNFLWFGIPIIGWPFALIFNKKQERTTSTFVETVINYIWAVASFAMILASVMSSFKSVPILFIILLIAGMCTTITGLIIKFHSVAIGGVISILLSIPMLYNIQIGGVYCNLFIFALAFTVTMIIPGHILNYRGRKALKNV